MCIYLSRGRCGGGGVGSWNRINWYRWKLLYHWSLLLSFKIIPELTIIFNLKN